MTFTTTTHLNFAGTAREALEFYQRVFGGELAVSTYAEFGMPAEAPDASKVVFGSVTAENGFRVMAYDVPGAPAIPAGSTRRDHGTTITDQAFFISLNGSSLDDLSLVWEKLAEGATIVEPLAASAWSPGFGMLTDRFGVTWAVSVAG